jgi:hypothetical protein
VRRLVILALTLMYQRRLELTGFLLMVYGTLAVSRLLDLACQFASRLTLDPLRLQYKQLLRLPWTRLYAAEKRESTQAAYRSPFMGSLHK